MSSQSTSLSGPILEGVFAVNKPPAISSAQVIRDLQKRFDQSKLFRPLIDRQQTKLASERQQGWTKKRRQKTAGTVKMGHGGTLDPMATGVLILGVGSGTKALGSFLGCQKSYECVVLFGAATDTFDTEGKVVGRKAYEHVTRDRVNTALNKFRGKIMQKPPVFSALWVNGKRLYEYARTGEEIPVKIEERSVEVLELDMVDWYDGGQHEWNWPDREADNEEKLVAEKVMFPDPDSVIIRSKTGEDRDQNDQKEDDQSKEDEKGKDWKSEDQEGEVQSDGDQKGNKRKRDDNWKKDDDPLDSKRSRLVQESPSSAAPICNAPAVKLRMTVTSGFYVRSLCHDLGLELGTLGMMASLVRTQQAEFELGKNVLEYGDETESEDVWAPKVAGLLKGWEEKHGGSEGLEKASQLAKEAARRHDEKRNRNYNVKDQSSHGKLAGRKFRPAAREANTSSEGE